MSLHYLFPALNEDQRMILDSVEVFCAGELIGRAESIDHAAEIAPEVLEQIAELGLLAICIPEEQGGAGFDQASYHAALIEMARASATCALHVVLQCSGFLEPIARGGCAETSVFEAAATGTAMAALAAFEGEGGFDAAAISATLTERDGKLVLDGVKENVVGPADASEFLVFAREGAGISAVVVPADAAGLVLGAPLDRLGMRGVAARSLRFDGLELPMSRRVGLAGEAAGLLEETATRLMIALASIGVGIMQAARDCGARYATERQQFRRPIADFEAMRERLATAEIGQAAVLNLVFSAARGLDEGADVAQLARIAKTLAGEFAMKAADDVLQVYGGYGYSQEYPAERLYRDARYVALALGGDAATRCAIAARILPE
ncbi:MAG: acyl-CoA dehydrogenase family protein [Planctomycetes bacterium]|nr:acyl-CoA dehydrogenase family protein [Planctomycetota bacterium]